MGIVEEILESIAELQKDLDETLAKREQVQMKQMDRIHRGEMTRARTTTSNANVDRLNERIVWARGQIKALKAELKAAEAANN